MTIAGMTILLYSCINITSFIRQIQTMPDHAKQTILDWLSLFRGVCSTSTSNMRKLGGPAFMSLQIREPYLQAVLNTALQHSCTVMSIVLIVKVKNVRDQFRCEFLYNGFFGLLTTTGNVRIFIVPNRIAETLLAIMEEYAGPRSCILSNE